MFTLFLRSDVMEGGGSNIRKFERVGIDRTSGNYERRNGKGEDEGTRRRVTAFVQRRKKIRAINGVGRVPTIFIGSGSPFDPGDTEEIMPPVTVS